MSCMPVNLFGGTFHGLVKLRFLIPLLARVWELSSERLLMGLPSVQLSHLLVHYASVSPVLP